MCGILKSKCVASIGSDEMSGEDNQLARLSNLIDKAQEVLATYYVTSRVLGGPNLDTQLAAGWRTQALYALDQLIGQNNTYYENFRSNTEHYDQRGSVKAGLGILESLKADIEAGYMQSYRQQLSAEFLVDLFDQAEHLLGNGFHLAAASVAGAALENGLREMAVRSGIKLRKREDLSTLAGKLADKEIISRQAQKEVAAMADVRNPADHGELEKINPANVDWMVKNANSFLSRHAT